MKNYQKAGRGDSRGGGFRGGRPEITKGATFKSRGGEREMVTHKAVCSECRKNCDVPFRPTGEKPVYCRDCFANKRGGEERAVRQNSSYESKKYSQEPAASLHTGTHQESSLQNNFTSEETKRQLLEINLKLEKLVLVVEKMSMILNESMTRIQKESMATPTSVVVKKSTPKKGLVAKKVIVPVKKTTIKKEETKTIFKKAPAKKAVSVIAKKGEVKKTSQPATKTVTKKVANKK